MAVTLREALTMEFPERQLVWGDWLARGERMMLVGPAKRAHKSTLLMNLAVHLSAGEPFLGQPVPAPLRVIYLDFEMGEAALIGRARRIAEASGLEECALDSLVLCSARGAGVDPAKPKFAHSLVDWAIDQKADAVMIDPILAGAVIDENVSHEVGALLRAVQDPLANAGCITVIVQHTPKGSGSNALMGSARARGSGKWGEHQELTIVSVPHKTWKDSFTLEFEARHIAEPAPIAIVRCDGDIMEADSITEVVLTHSTGHSQKHERLVAIVEDHGRIAQAKLVALLGSSASSVSKSVKALATQGRVRVTLGDKARGERSNANFVESITAETEKVSEEDGDAL